jgi:hypothetical protein
MGNAGILEQIQVYKKQYYRPITLQEVDNFLNELSKQNKMSKRYYNKKKAMTAQMTDEQIKAIMDLYKPNFIQRLFMKYFSKQEVTRRPRQILTAACIIVFGLGIVFNSLAEIIVGLSVALPLIAGTVYGMITNKKRIAQLMSVLSMTEDQVKALEVKYYLA